MSSGLSALYHGSAIYHLRLVGRAPRELLMRLEPWPGDAALGQALLAGEFRFLNETVRAPTPPWRAGASEEWHAALHGFEWLADLAAVGSERGLAERRGAGRAEWLSRFDIYDRLAWRG